MKPPFRIAVLECDTPLTKTRAKYGGYGGVFKALLQAGADNLNMPEVLSSSKGLDITTWDVVNVEQYPKLDDIDAVLLTGSRHNSFDNDPWIVKLVEFTERVLASNRIRTIGVCFGHQIVGRALGVKVDRSPIGWETSVCGMDLSDAGKQIFKRDALHIFQMHTDIVFELPAGVEDLGSSPRCRVQGMYSKGKLISVQGHPEFTSAIVTELLEARHAQGIFDDAAFEDGMSRVDQQHDGVVIASAFLRFLLED